MWETEKRLPRFGRRRREARWHGDNGEQVEDDGERIQTLRLRLGLPP
jgi:hypothetical protein